MAKSHTIRCVWEKKTSMFPILDTNLCITLSSYPLALLSSAFASCCVCSIDRSVSHWKKARRLPHAPAPRHRSCGVRSPGGSRLAAEFCFTTGFLLVCTATVYYTAAIAHAAAASRRSSWLSFFLLSSTMWEESSLSINPHCTIEKVHGLTPTKMLEIWSIPKKDYARFILGRK